MNTLNAPKVVNDELHDTERRYDMKERIKLKSIKIKKRWIALGVAVLMLLAFFHAKPPTWIYYSIESNYITVTGTVKFINREESAVYFACNNLSHCVYDCNFELTGANYREAVNNGLWQKLECGEQIEIVIPKLFYGNGYVYPVAAISIDGVEYLSFEEGLRNMRTLKYLWTAPTLWHTADLTQ